MQLDNACGCVHPMFQQLPTKVQEETLALIQQVNEQHLHCEDQEVWIRTHSLITCLFAKCYNEKLQVKTNLADNPVKMDLVDPDLFGKRIHSQMIPLSHAEYSRFFTMIKNQLQDTFHDPLFANPILEALQQHIFIPLSRNAELVQLISKWIYLNVMYLPLGNHLLSAYKEDMEGKSSFAQYVMKDARLQIIPEALSQETLLQVEAFLAIAAQAHAHSYEPPSSTSECPTAVMLSIQAGAGGHTAPTDAMASRLQERGWRVKTIYIDKDLSPECDPFQLLGITFEDGSPMTHALYITRWTMQKHMVEVSEIVSHYVVARKTMTPDLFVNDSGGDLFRKKILPLNPQLLITTLAYHPIWRNLAYRVTGAKTLLVASDVFFHREALYPWYRQHSLAPSLRKIHFTTMTEDIELLTSMGTHHDHYYLKKYPGEPLQSLTPLTRGIKIDSQISVIGAPIHPDVKAITDPLEIYRLRKKWDVPDSAMCVCISRGKLGYNDDLIPALESYRSREKLPLSLVLQVVCGENAPFFERLLAGEYKNLGPNITVLPRPLLSPKDFAELRAISTIDDIKAGGGSTFEGWYLISHGNCSMLLLTPGPELWWENSNCDAMEKWGVGQMVRENTNKIAIVKKVMEKGLPPITYPFPDWKSLFDKTVDSLASEAKK